MESLTNGTNKPIYKTEIESQIQKTNLWLPRGAGVRDKLGDCNRHIYAVWCTLHAQLCPTAIPWTVAHQAPLFMGFPRQEY